MALSTEGASRTDVVLGNISNAITTFLVVSAHGAAEAILLRMMILLGTGVRHPHVGC